MILAVDFGTTTTRVWALDGGAILAGASTGSGARDFASTKEADALLETVRAVADQTLRTATRSWADVAAVVAFGMITSELGLEELPHVRAPIDPPALSAALVERRYPELLPATLYLVPGVLTGGDGDEDATDAMRGEETEVVGLLALDVRAPLVYLSTGSHTKFVAVDAEGRIDWSLTTLSGELLWALRQETILAPLVDLERPLEDIAAAEHGAAVAEREGVTRALFVARILNRVHGHTRGSCSAFVHGAVAGSDIAALRRRFAGDGSGRVRIAIGGRGPLADAYAHLLEKQSWVEDVGRLEQPVGALGAWALYTAHRERRGLPDKRLVGER